MKIWYLGTDVKAKLALIFRYAGKDKLYHDLNSASYINKIRRKQCRWDTSSSIWILASVQPVAPWQATSWPASSFPLQLQRHHLGSRCLQVAVQIYLLWWLDCSCSALKPFYSGSPPPSPALSSSASVRTHCWQTPPSPQLPGDNLTMSLLEQCKD